MNKRVYKPHREREARIKSAVAAISALLPLDLYPAHKKELISVCLWKITEADGKLNVQYWSEGALSADKKELRHEHVYERRELIQRLLDGETPESVVCNAIACIVTREEHKLLSESEESGWNRYSDANVRVFDIKKQEWRT